MQEIYRALANGFRKRSATLQHRQILGFCGVPSISAVPEAGNAGNLQGPWKWLPEKERTLQNRQLLGFCGVPSISAVPEAGNPGNPQGPWKWLPEKERTARAALFLVYLSFWKGLDVVENNEKYEVCAFQGHNPRDSCRILSFLVVFPDGFWAFAGFSQTKSGQNMTGIAGKQRKIRGLCVSGPTILVTVVEF